MQRFNDWARDPDTAAPAPLATVAVKNHGTDTLTTTYSDDGVTPKANPFSAAADTGIFAFYAANGRYDVTVTPAPGEGEAYSIPDVLLNDPED